MREFEFLFVAGIILACCNGQYIIEDVWGQPPNSYSGWSTSLGSVSSSYVNTCGSQTIIGGYDKFGVDSWAQKTYSGLPGHNTVSIQFEAYFIDSWDGGLNNPGQNGNDSLSLLVDGTSRYYKLYTSSMSSTTEICGLDVSNDFKDWKTTVNIGPFNHNSTTITLRFITGLDQPAGDESFGFKNIKITVDAICAPACATCEGNAVSQCNSCKNGWYLSGTTCVADCPNGFWGDSSTKTCKSCYSSSSGPYYTCATCSAGANNNCNSCNSGKFLHSNTCINSCPAGFWGDSSAKTCKPCYSGSGPDYYTCATCSAGASNNCNSCNSGKFLHSNRCIASCPDGFWGDSSTKTCKPCYIGSGPYYTCVTCSGGGSNNCNSCNTGSFLHLNTCITPCPNGFWGDTFTKTCRSCYSGSGPDYYTCATCSGGASDNCNSCNSGSFLYLNTCINPCPAGFWGETSTNTCKPCYSGSGPDYYTCATCSAGASNNCNSCNSGAFLYSNTCINPCPNGFWGETLTNTCQPCFEGAGPDYYTCATCSGGANNNCNSCNSGSFLYLNTCVNPCPDGFWGDTSTDTCQPCYSGSGPDYYTCATCSAGSSNDCDSCNSGSFLYLNACINPCPDGFWGDTSTNTCQPCFDGLGPDYYTCATCSAGANNDCNSCHSGSFLHLNTCINPCPDGYWGNTSINTCEPCHSSSISPYTCATCNGGSYTDCNSCNSGYFLYPNTGGKCLNPCPDGFWGDALTNTCQSCHSSTIGPYYSCATCSGGSYNNCSSCDSGTFLHLSQCLDACPNGYWADNSTNTCQICTLSSVYISTCKTGDTAVPALQSAATSGSIASAALSSALQFASSGSGTVAVNLILFLSAIESIANQRFLNINHSQTALDAYEGLSLSIIPNWISVFNSLDNDTLVFHYGIFERNKLSPLYLDNFGDTLTEIMGYAVLCFIAFALTLRIKTPEKLLSSPIGKGYAVIFGVFLCSTFGQLQSQILFSTLQILKTDLLVDNYTRLSYSMAWLSMYGVLFLQLFCFCKLRAIYATKERYKTTTLKISEDGNSLSNPAISSKFRWTEKKYEILFNNFKEDKKKRFFFTFWTNLFNAAYITLIIVLQDVPIVQCLSITALTFGFIIFSAIVKPIKGKNATFLYFFNFVCVLFVAILNTTIAIKESQDSQQTINNTIGWVVFITIGVNSGMNILFALCDTLYGIFTLIKYWIYRGFKPKEKPKEEPTLSQNLRKEKITPEVSLSSDPNTSTLNLMEKGTSESPDQDFINQSKNLKIMFKEKRSSFMTEDSGLNVSEIESRDDTSISIYLGRRGTPQTTLQDSRLNTESNKSEFGTIEKETVESTLQNDLDQPRRLKVIIKEERQMFKVKNFCGFVIPESELEENMNNELGKSGVLQEDALRNEDCNKSELEATEKLKIITKKRSRRTSSD